MTCAIEPARAGDGDAIGRILSAWIDETDWMPRVHTRQEDIAHGNWLVEIMDVRVARLGGRVVGFIARRGQTVHALYLLAEARGRGIGAALLRAVMADAERLELWTFQANLGARRFYARHGLVEALTTEGAGNDEKLPDIKMIWERRKE